MTIETVLTVDGSVLAGDHDDEGAPLFKLTFHNEATGLSEECKLAMMKAALDVLDRPQRDGHFVEN